MNSQLPLAGATRNRVAVRYGNVRPSEKLTLPVTTNVGSAPSTVTVRAYLAPNADSGRLRIEADSVSLCSSEVQLDGDKAPMLTEFRLKSLPSGEYTVRATLFDAMGEETVGRRTATIRRTSGSRPSRAQAPGSAPAPFDGSPRGSAKEMPVS